MIGIFLGLSILFGSGVAALQIAGLALRSSQVQEAANAGADDDKRSHAEAAFERASARLEVAAKK